MCFYPLVAQWMVDDGIMSMEGSVQRKKTRSQSSGMWKSSNSNHATSNLTGTEPTTSEHDVKWNICVCLEHMCINHDVTHEFALDSRGYRAPLPMSIKFTACPPLHHHVNIASSSCWIINEGSLKYTKTKNHRAGCTKTG